jgi:hypothetical protein
MACVYGIGRIAANGRAGLLAAALVASYPPIIHLSRIYRPHGAIPAFVALSLLLLLVLLRGRRPRTAWALGISLAAGILIHPTFVYAIAAPLLCVGVYATLFQKPPRAPTGPSRLPVWLAEKLRDPLVWRGLLPAALVTLAAASWYPLAGGDLIETAQRFSGKRTVQLAFPETRPGFWWYALTAPHAITNGLAALALLGGVWCAVRGGIAARVVALGLLAGYAIQSLTWVRVWWYFAPLLPFAAAASAIGISWLKPTWLARSAAAASLTLAGLAFTSSTWGLPPALGPLALALGAPLEGPECERGGREVLLCETPPRTVDWPMAAFVDAILVDAPDCAIAERTCRAFLAVKASGQLGTGPSPAIRSALFDYLVARDHVGARVDFRDAKWKRDCGRAAGLESDYLIHFAPAHVDARGCHGQWTRFLATPPGDFTRSRSRLVELPLPDGGTATLWKRTRELPPHARKRVENAWRAAKKDPERTRAP